ncbi:MAG: hypothetical protein GC168_05365 [Candidatus Hydrogenedens sp.]|nr:hypothetical protein [Candidatus Hydrogenedens sp.]
MTDRLTGVQRRMLLEMLYALAQADGKIVALEREVLQDYSELLGVSLDEIDGNFEIEELAPYFDSAESRVAVIEELCRLARLDGDFAEDERAAILRVADAMGIPAGMVSRIDEWVVDGLRWVAKGNDLIQEAERNSV